MFCSGFPAAAIYLCKMHPASASDSLWPVPLPNLGFSLAGFTRSTLYVSIKTRLCGTFKGSHPYHTG